MKYTKQVIDYNDPADSDGTKIQNQPIVSAELNLLFKNIIAPTKHSAFLKQIKPPPRLKLFSLHQQILC